MICDLGATEFVGLFCFCFSHIVKQTKYARRADPTAVGCYMGLGCQHILVVVVMVVVLVLVVRVLVVEVEVGSDVVGEVVARGGRWCNSSRESAAWSGVTHNHTIPCRC